MDRTERFYKIDQHLNESAVVSFNDLQARLEVSRATLTRDLAYMRDRLNAPIVFDRALNGYRFDRNAPKTGGQYDLPGLWFSAQEIHALLTMQHLLTQLDRSGLLGGHIAPLQSRLAALLGSTDDSVNDIARRVRIETVGAREYQLGHFQAIGSALLRRKRIHIDYHARGNDTVTQREISPQRLVHYRDNWYLDAWCHLREGLRAFSVDAILRLDTLEKKAKEISPRALDAQLGASYGIFRNTAAHHAVLVFTPERARWVRHERWHPQQKGRNLTDGRFELTLPYADDRELIMDILKYGADCTVVSPPALIQRVKAEITRLSALYATP
jgi:predicted DNA-binding transcriptional regulator YafY